MEILFLGKNVKTFRQIRENIQEEETICQYALYDGKHCNFEIEKTDIVILDGTNLELDLLCSTIKLICHFSKPVLALVGDISAREENYIWGMGVVDIMSLPFTKDECRIKIDNTYRWKWYCDRCKCRGTTI